jgi:predicted nucleotidyltransferase
MPPMDVAHVEQAIHTIARRTRGVIAVYLFGSTARGQAHRDSDIDVAVLLDWRTYPDATSRFEARLALTGAVGAQLGRNDVDLVVLNDAPPGLGRRIVTEGRAVFVADREEDHAFRRNAMLRAADVEPWLRRMRRLKLERLLP